ncbi:MAG: flagellin [Hydrogenothermaceae bacterium]|nr:flagellin [Hydrogenothermaceae bacterium]
MRITDLLRYDNYIKNDQIRQGEVEKYSKQIATGKKILQPSDDTVATVASLRLKRINEDFDSYLRNMDFASNVLDVAETTLRNISDAGTEIRVEIIRLLNTGVLDKDDANVLKDYFQQMKDYIIKTANTSIGDTRLFGGVASQQDPFDSNGVYQGQTTETKVPIAKGVEVNTTFDGSAYLGTGNVGGSKKILMVAAIDKIVQIINNAINGTGSLGELNTATINVNGTDMKILDVFDKGLNTILQYTSMIGTQQKIISDIKTSYQQNKVFNNNLISNLEDADTAETITNLQKAKTAYEALIAAFNSVKNLSLLDFFK